MGTKNEITWFKKRMENDPKITINEFSDLFANKGTKKYYRVYSEVSKSNIKENKK